jgi:hypothetical protein
MMLLCAFWAAFVAEQLHPDRLLPIAVRQDVLMISYGFRMPYSDSLRNEIFSQAKSVSPNRLSPRR